MITADDVSCSVVSSTISIHCSCAGLGAVDASHCTAVVGRREERKLFGGADGNAGADGGVGDVSSVGMTLIVSREVISLRCNLRLLERQRGCGIELIHVLRHEVWNLCTQGSTHTRSTVEYDSAHMTQISSSDIKIGQDAHVKLELVRA